MYCCFTALFSFELAEVAMFFPLKTYGEKGTHDMRAPPDHKNRMMSLTYNYIMIGYDIRSGPCRVPAVSQQLVKDNKTGSAGHTITS